MRALVERVLSARAISDGIETGRIGTGLLVYVGVAAGDADADAEYVAEKVRRLRIFPDTEGKMNRDVAEAGGGVLVVSAFSLLADARKGRRPAFDAAAPPDVAERLYEAVCRRLRDLGLQVETGRFRTMMSVESTNDGPITILLDSKRLL